MNVLSRVHLLLRGGQEFSFYEDPEENGCYPVQVIQDRLCVSWLAYS